MNMENRSFKNGQKVERGRENIKEKSDLTNSARCCVGHTRSGLCRCGVTKTPSLISQAGRNRSIVSQEFIKKKSKKVTQFSTIAQIHRKSGVSLNYALRRMGNRKYTVQVRRLRNK